jgi:hypothetical protein
VLRKCGFDVGRAVFLDRYGQLRIRHKRRAPPELRTRLRELHDAIIADLTMHPGLREFYSPERTCVKAEPHTKSQTAAMLPAFLRALKSKSYKVVHVVPRDVSASENSQSEAFRKQLNGVAVRSRLRVAGWLRRAGEAEFLTLVLEVAERGDRR